MKKFLFGVLLLPLCGCLNNNIPKLEHSKPIVVFSQTEYDIFNLRWGMKRDECYKICDWGGKLESEVKPPILGSHLLKFEKGKLYIKFSFNENDCLYMADMLYIYPDLQFSSAKEFYYFLRGILNDKYKLKHDSFDHRYFGTVDTVLFEHLLAGRVSFITYFESCSSEITLAMVPWSVPNSFEKRVVLSLEYRSKIVKNNNPAKIDLKSQKDAAGL